MGEKIDNDRQQLWVFWVLGNEYHFLRVLDALIGYCKINKDGAFITHEGHGLFDGTVLTPPLLDGELNLMPQMR